MPNGLEIEDLIALDEGDLLALLADELLGGGRGISVGDLGKRVEFAKQWIEERTELLRDALCSNEAFRKASSGSTREAWIELSVVVDAVVTIGLQRPIATVVVAILVGRGHRALCGAATAG